MAAVTNSEKSMATEVTAPEPQDEGRKPQPSEPLRAAAPSQGYFTIYKKGQGYWTRLCTALGAVLLIALTVSFVWDKIPPQITAFLTPDTSKMGQAQANQAVHDAIAKSTRISIGIVAGFAIGAMLLAWRITNKPTNVDFLVATDSEMKKVNWTSKQELIGSTKVVILFMFAIAILLFVTDMYFTRVFHLVGILTADAPVWMAVGSHFGAAGEHLLDVVMTIIIGGGSAWGIYEAAKGIK